MDLHALLLHLLEAIGVFDAPTPKPLKATAVNFNLCKLQSYRNRCKGHSMTQIILSFGFSSNKSFHLEPKIAFFLIKPMHFHKVSRVYLHETVIFSTSQDKKQPK